MASRIDLQNSATNTNIPDNGNNEIGAEDVRNQFEAERNSAFNLDDDDAYAVPFSSNNYVAENVGAALEEAKTNDAEVNGRLDNNLLLVAVFKNNSLVYTYPGATVTLTIVGQLGNVNVSGVGGTGNLMSEVHIFPSATGQLGGQGFNVGTSTDVDLDYIGVDPTPSTPGSNSLYKIYKQGI